MTMNRHTLGCYGPAELKRMGFVFDELWRDVAPQFRNASPEFITSARSRLALDILDLRCDSIDELKVYARAAFALRFESAGIRPSKVERRVLLG